MKRFVSFIVLTAFVLNSFGITAVHANMALPTPGTMVNLSPAFEPALIKGLTINKDNPFVFDFIVDAGENNIEGNELKQQSDRMIKYFFSALSVPEKDTWVNLSPYEKDRIVPDALGQTAMGRDLLAQDYILKQLTASLLYPEKDLGKKFWDKIYAKARETYGADVNIPVNTFNKVWIVAEKAHVYEHGQTAWVVDGHLKVMLEEDYLALSRNSHTLTGPVTATLSQSSEPQKQAPPVGRELVAVPPVNVTKTLSTQVIRDLIIPEIENEVNTGKNFAQLRQIFNSLILATWFKKNLKESIINKAITDKNIVNGLVADAQSLSTEKIYQQYLQAYKKGVFNLIKEEQNPITKETLPRKYFSGGFTQQQGLEVFKADAAMVTKAMRNNATLKRVSVALAKSGSLRVAPKDAAMMHSTLLISKGQKGSLLINSVNRVFNIGISGQGSLTLSSDGDVYLKYQEPLRTYNLQLHEKAMEGITGLSDADKIWMANNGLVIVKKASRVFVYQIGFDKESKIVFYPVELSLIEKYIASRYLNTDDLLDFVGSDEYGLDIFKTNFFEEFVRLTSKDGKVLDLLPTELSFLIQKTMRSIDITSQAMTAVEPISIEKILTQTNGGLLTKSFKGKGILVVIDAILRGLQKKRDDVATIKAQLRSNEIIDLLFNDPSLFFYQFVLSDKGLNITFKDGSVINVWSRFAPNPPRMRITGTNLTAEQIEAVFASIMNQFGLTLSTKDRQIPTPSANAAMVSPAMKKKADLESIRAALTKSGSGKFAFGGREFVTQKKLNDLGDFLGALVLELDPELGEGLIDELITNPLDSQHIITFQSTDDTEKEWMSFLDLFRRQYSPLMDLLKFTLVKSPKHQTLLISWRQNPKLGEIPKRSKIKADIKRVVVEIDKDMDTITKLLSTETSQAMTSLDDVADDVVLAWEELMSDAEYVRLSQSSPLSEIFRSGTKVLTEEIGDDRARIKKYYLLLSDVVGALLALYRQNKTIAERPEYTGDAEIIERVRRFNDFDARFIFPGIMVEKLSSFMSALEGYGKVLDYNDLPPQGMQDPAMNTQDVMSFGEIQEMMGREVSAYSRARMKVYSKNGNGFLGVTLLEKRRHFQFVNVTAFKMNRGKFYIADKEDDGSITYRVIDPKADLPAKEIIKIKRDQLPNDVKAAFGIASSAMVSVTRKFNKRTVTGLSAVLRDGRIFTLVDTILTGLGRERKDVDQMKVGRLGQREPVEIAFNTSDLFIYTFNLAQQDLRITFRDGGFVSMHYSTAKSSSEIRIKAEGFNEEQIVNVFEALMKQFSLRLIEQKADLVSQAMIVPVERIVKTKNYRLNKDGVKQISDNLKGKGILTFPRLVLRALNRQQSEVVSMQVGLKNNTPHTLRFDATDLGIYEFSLGQVGLTIRFQEQEITLKYRRTSNVPEFTVEAQGFTDNDVEHVFAELSKSFQLEEKVDKLLPVAAGDAALTSPTGGIDLNTADMGMTIETDAQGGVQVKVDSAMIEQIKREGFKSINPVIINITPIQDIRPFLGLSPA